MSGGALNPDLTSVVMAMKNYRATEIVSPYTDGVSMQIMEDELEARWKASNMQDGQLVVAMRGSEGQHLAWLNSRNGKNGHSKHSKGDLTNPWEHAAMAGAAIESQVAVDPVYPLMGAKLKGYMPARPADDLEATEINNILLAGGSPTINQNGDGYLGRMVTNYTETRSGAQDEKYRNLNWIKTMSEWRWFVTNKWLVDVIEEGFKLAKYVTDPIPGQRIVTNDFVQEFMLRLVDLWIEAGRFQNRDGYKQAFLSEIDSSHGRVKIQEEPTLITQLYQVEGASAYRTS